MELLPEHGPVVGVDEIEHALMDHVRLGGRNVKTSQLDGPGAITALKRGACRRRPRSHLVEAQEVLDCRGDVKHQPLRCDHYHKAVQCLQHTKFKYVSDHLQTKRDCVALFGLRAEKCATGN